jgi:stage II sporulation protein D (peptidoglycan lytic transglycosylase)
MRRVCFVLLSLVFPLLAQSQPRTVRIGVLSIFHPHELTIAADPAGELMIAAGGQRIFLQQGSSCSLLRVRSAGEDLLLNCGTMELHEEELRASGRNQQAAGIVVTLPGKIKRRYVGVLELKAKRGELFPIITMDLETAVASVVQAETIPGTPLEALKAQAIVSRSYFVSGGGRHGEFDFCDLTHCQFLREPPASDSSAANAAASTRGLVLTYEEKPVAAMFTRSCGGRTRTLEEIRVSQKGYPYFSVRCDSCYNNPVRWSRKVSRDDAELLKLRGENGRLAIGRRLGWNAVPSNNFTAQESGGEVTLSGVGQGHGLGLCQRGARGMAEGGSDFRAILDHYFPDTRLVALAAAERSPF